MLTLHNPAAYTIETVLKGHPDKVCDQISDAILDSYLQADENSKVAVECVGCGNVFFICGEISSNAEISIENTVKKTYASIGYLEEVEVINKIHKQSEQLQGVVRKGLAGDQGIMYGFADNQGSNFLPFGVQLISSIGREIDKLREETMLFLPDGKIQLTIENGKVKKMIVSVQHFPYQNLIELEKIITDRVVANNLDVSELENFYFNYNSNFISGGIANDAGLTGRKIIIDTYCGLAPHGGGAFSGKDPSKVDRSGAYMSRFLAKNIVANGFAQQCLVSVAYGFGIEEPLMLNIETGNKNRDKSIFNHVKSKFDFRPNSIIERLNLLQFKYLPTSSYGHFTNVEFPWERVINI